MADPLGSHDFAYVHSDIPAGMTIREWKRDRAAARAIERRPERATRRTSWSAAPRAGGRGSGLAEQELRSACCADDAGPAAGSRRETSRAPRGRGRRWPGRLLPCRCGSWRSRSHPMGCGPQ